MERLRAQQMLSWEQEAQKLRAFGLQDGMRVLELGSGPGFMTEQLLLLLPHSTITAIDIAPEMVEYAQYYLAGNHEERWEVVLSSINALPFPDASFDFAIARFVFQHLPDPYEAARAVWRVLKPGRIFVILDSDIDFAFIAEPSYLNPQQVQQTAQRQAARGGDRYIGRFLPRILKASGFVSLRLEAIISHSDILGVEPFFFELAPDRSRVQPLIDAGKMTEEEFQARQEYFEQRIADPNFLVMLILLAASGIKPP
jgi:ubiquinone/menaquinone biosynthesis C-methylase UbiE